MSNLGLTEIVVLATIVTLVGTCLWGIVDASNRADDAWRSAGHNKPLWITLQAVGLLCTGLGGLVMSIIYLAVIRPEVRAAEVVGAHR